MTIHSTPGNSNISQPLPADAPAWNAIKRCENCGAPHSEHGPDWACPTTAVDWLMAVRRYGIEKANEMFPAC